MRKLIVRMSVSLNAFVAGPNGESEWIFAHDSPDQERWHLAHMWDTGLHLMGRRTFDDMKEHWPTSTESYAAPMNAIPKAFFSHHADAVKETKDGDAGDIASWNAARCITGDLVTELKNLKAEGGKSIVAWGGTSFVRSLVPTGLVDEYQFIVFPTALQGGAEIFSGLEKPLGLKLVALDRFDSGVMAQTYRPE
jgi:dihydrofolate reductase